MIEFILLYLTKVAIGSSIMYICYYIFFKNDTFYGRNRVILILAILLPVVIPAINFSRLFIIPSEGTNYVVEAESIVATPYYIGSAISNTIHRISFIDIVFYIYLAGLLFSFIKIARGVIIIQRILNACVSVKNDVSLFTITDNTIPPFSYYKKIIIPNGILRS